MQISTLIGTCDAYAHLHRNFAIQFSKYWTANTNNFVAAETIEIEGFENIHAFGDWGQRILHALNYVKTEFVVFLLEDYYLSESIDDNFLDGHLKILEEFQADKVMFDTLYPDGVYSLSNIRKDLYKFNNDSQYLNSVQPAIWRTDYLKSVLYPDFSPWDFEIVGNRATAKKNPTIILAARPEKIYFNFCRKGGVLSEGWEEFLKKENLC